MQGAIENQQNSNPHTGEPGESPFEPFIPPQKHIKEFTLKAVLLGILFAIIFGASAVNLALGAGVTVGGAISITVIAVGLVKRFGKTTILENNIIQTIGSASESSASGLVFRVTGLIFLAEGARYFTYTRLVVIAILGSVLGILFMIPLRRSLVSKEHHVLPFPEGKACAEVLIEGEREKSSMMPVILGALTGMGYWIFMRLTKLWKEIPNIFDSQARFIYPNATFNLQVFPEYLGIGYIIGPRTSTQMMIGGILSWLVIIPLFSKLPQLSSVLQADDVRTTLNHLGEKMVGTDLPAAVDVYKAYGRFIGMGAVVCAGLITLIKTLPTIFKSFHTTVKSFSERREVSPLRTEKDLPNWVIVIGLGVLILLFLVLPQFPWTFPLSLLVLVLILIFGFFFVTVSSRFAGLVGYSMEPITPMMFTTVILVCFVFFLFRLRSGSDQAMVLMIGAVVCLAASNAGATSQDLKTGFLVGATPWKQQVGFLIGVIVSAVVISGLVILIDKSNPGITHTIGFVFPKEKAARFSAPQASVTAMLIQTAFRGDMPWGLVLFGASLALIAYLCRLNALSFAIGIYLPIAVTAPIFLGAGIRWLTERKEKQEKDQGSEREANLKPGMLCATGLVAGGALTGMLLGFFKSFFPSAAKRFDLGGNYWSKIEPYGDYLAVCLFFVLGAFLYIVSRRKFKSI